MDEVSKNLIEPVSKMLSPLASSIGQTLQDIWNLVIGDRISFAHEKNIIEYANKAELFKRELAESINTIPLDEITEPNIQTITQILDNSKYCINEDGLRKMFVLLIQSSMKKSKKETIHPSFSQVITQMSPEDALVLSVLYKKYGYGGYIPVLQIRAVIKGTSKFYKNVFPKWSVEIETDNLDMFQVASCLEDLKVLGLINIEYDRSIISCSEYEEILQSNKIQDIFSTFKKGCTDEVELKSTECASEITDFGYRFAQCCLD